MPRTLVSLGSNLGDATAALDKFLDKAIEGLKGLAKPGSLRVSDRLVTTPVGGPPGQAPFLNAAAALDCDLSPQELLAAVQAIEHALDRRRHARWAARTIDVDLLLYGDAVVNEPRLRVPHPRMSFRPFVLVPATQIAGDWPHPECGRTLAELLDQLQHGADALCLVGDDGSRVRLWIEQDRGATLRVVDDPAGIADPRLTIDARAPDAAPPIPGPRLVLADCAEEHWRDEVLAAVECVWPRDRPD